MDVSVGLLIVFETTITLHELSLSLIYLLNNLIVNNGLYILYTSFAKIYERYF